MSREHRDEGKEAAPPAASVGASPTRRVDAPVVDAGYQAQCDARVLQFLSAPLPLTPSEREAREAGGDASGVHAAAERGVSGAATVLPHGDTIQAAFGPHDISGVRAHVGGAAADACGAMGASAYATGNQVAFAGQPDLHTAAHEAAHVVQQRQGVQLYGGVGEVGDVYERQADVVADAVVAGKSAAGLLGAPSAEAVSTKSVQAFGGLYIAGASPAAQPAANGGAAPASTAAVTGPSVNRLVATDPSVEFGPTPVGATTYKPLTFVNRGAEPVEPSDFVVRPGVNAQEDDFSVAGGDATSGAALAPGEAISLQVAFHPHPRPDQDPKRWPGRVAHIDVLDLAGAWAGSVKVRGKPRPTDEATQGAHEAAELVGASRNHADVAAPVSYADMLANLRAARELLSTGDRDHAQALIHAVRERMAGTLREDKSWPRLRGFGLGAQAGLHLINEAYDAVVAADRGLGADWRVDGDKLVMMLEAAREPIQFVLKETKDAPTLRAFHDASPAVMVGNAIEGMAEHTIEMVTDAEYTVGYLSGLVEGAYGAVRDLVMGFADLVGMTADIVKAMWSRGFVGAVQHFGRQVADIFDKAPELLEALGADFARKWNQHGSFDRGNFRGEVMGYIAMQILLIIATAGEGAAAAAGRWPKVLQVIRTLDAAGDIFTWAETAADGVRALRKGAKAVGKAEDAVDAAGKGGGKVLKMGGGGAPDAPSAGKVPGGPEVDAPKAGAPQADAPHADRPASAGPDAPRKGGPYKAPDDPTREPHHPVRALEDDELASSKDLRPVQRGRDLVADGSRPVGKVLKTRAEGEAILQLLAQGDRNALAALDIVDIPKKLKVTEREWALVQTRDGFLVYIGDAARVDLPANVRSVAHSHPTHKQGKRLELDVPDGKGGVAFTDIVKDPHKAADTGLLPSAMDLHVVSDGTEHTLHTQFVMDWDGTITNAVEGDTRPRVQVRISKSRVIRYNEGRKGYWYQAQLDVSAGGQAIWSGDFFGRRSFIAADDQVKFHRFPELEYPPSADQVDP